MRVQEVNSEFNNPELIFIGANTIIWYSIFRLQIY